VVTDGGIDWRAIVLNGGVTMWPLVACSVVTLAMLLERGASLAGVGRRGRAVAGEVLVRVSRGDAAGALDACRKSRSPLAGVLAAGLDRASDATSAAGVVERARTLAAHELREGLWILGTIGAAAPFVGLFGTVVGIIRSFRDIAAAGNGGFSTVAEGISEALVATAGGILIAVVAFIAHNAFQVTVAGIVAEWKLWSEELLAALSTQRARAVPDEAAT